MTFRLTSNFAAISAVQLIWTMLASGQARVNPQAEAMAERIEIHIANLATGIRLARADAKAGDVFNGAAEPFRQIIREDAKDLIVDLPPGAAPTAGR